jgi:pimeloyl-ACP methyl ester carboxylesterase
MRWLAAGLGFFLLYCPASAQRGAGWSDTFESYRSLGQLSSVWLPDGNTTGVNFDTSVRLTGAQSIKLDGVIGGCWGALVHRRLEVKPPFTVELHVRNGAERLSGCHPNRGTVDLYTRPSWSASGRMLIGFAGDGSIRGASNAASDITEATRKLTSTTFLGNYSTNGWTTVRFSYERPDSTKIRVGYWINEIFQTSEELPALSYEGDLAYLSLWAQEGSAWYDDVSVQAGATSPLSSQQPPQTVFLVHGILQGGGDDGDLAGLASSLRGALDAKRFVVDAGFDFRRCAKSLVPALCNLSCTIGGTDNASIETNGARALGAYIDKQNPSGPVTIVAYSMGGLIARDMILNRFSKHDVGTLITIGTPHLGYPYQSLSDERLACGLLSAQMFGDFINAEPSSDHPVLKTKSGDVSLSTYLYQLMQRWEAAQPDQLPRRWYAAAGSSCSKYTRIAPLIADVGCLAGTLNDGVVCAQSASYNFGDMKNSPTDRWEDPNHRYAHTGYPINVFCGVSTGITYPLADPGGVPGHELLQKIAEWIGNPGDRPRHFQK